MNLVLLQDWNSLPSGFRLVGVQAGQAEIMIQRGIASESTDDREKQQRQQPRKQK
jgi:hypothetical protein